MLTWPVKFPLGKDPVSPLSCTVGMGPVQVWVVLTQSYSQQRHVLKDITIYSLRFGHCNYSSAEGKGFVASPLTS